MVVIAAAAFLALGLLHFDFSREWWRGQSVRLVIGIPLCLLYAYVVMPPLVFPQAITLLLITLIPNVGLTIAEAARKIVVSRRIVSIRRTPILPPAIVVGAVLVFSGVLTILPIVDASGLRDVTGVTTTSDKPPTADLQHVRVVPEAVPSDNGCYGRRELEDYVRLGYVPADKGYHAPVSCTLDYAYNDFCVSQVARFLGRNKEAEILRPRALNYRNVFDPSVGFMRERLSDGSWKSPFREFAWGGGFVEGGPWQHSFNVPHDPEGLAALLGGPKELCRKLDSMLSLPAIFEVGTYGFEIHEMTEMALAGFGQYAHSNQPVHGFLFLYALMGEPEKTSHWVHRVANELYSPDSLPGDEDNGEMSAWYVWATLGLYPQCPGKPGYIRFQPLAKCAFLARDDAYVDRS